MLKDLVEKRARLWEQAKELLTRSEAEKRELSAEEEQKFDALHADIDKLKVQIDREQRQATVEAELSRSNGRAAEPPRPDAARGTVVADRVPDRLATVRAAELAETERIEALRCWLLAGSDQRHTINAEQLDIVRRSGIDLNMKQLTIMFPARALRSLHEPDVASWLLRVQATTPGAVGGYTIPDETMRSLEVALLTYGGMRQVATIIRTDTGADLPWPTTNDTGNLGVLLGENQQVTQQDVAFGQLVLQAYKYSSKMVLVSVELLQDNAVNLAQFLGTALGERIGRITNQHFTTGTGVSQPMGLVTAATQGTVAGAGSTTSASYDNLVDLEHSIDPAYRTGARFMWHDTTLKAFKKLKDTTGRPLWAPGIAVSNPDTVLGYPYTINQDMPVMAANAKSILFGQLAKYIIRDVRGVTLMRLDERYADYHQVAFLAFARYDGDLLDAGTHPVKYFANSAT